MPGTFARLLAQRVSWFGLAVFATGVALFVATIGLAIRGGHGLPVSAVICVPVIVVVARFPMVIDSLDGGIEVGFDPTVLMFLLCTLDAHDALLLWSLGVVLTQLTSGKKLSSLLFNIGIGICAGGLAAAVLVAVGGGRTGTPSELLAVALGAVAYFSADYLASAASIAISSGTGIRNHVVGRPTLWAIACFVPFDTLGYLSAVVHRVAPWWTQLLFAVLLVTMLIATRAVNRARENARRLTVLFEAALKAQSLADRGDVTRALLEDTRQLLHVADAELRDEPPTRREIGARIDLGSGSRWIVTPALGRALDDRGRRARPAGACGRRLGRLRPPRTHRRDGPRRPSRPADRPAEPRHPPGPARARPRGRASAGIAGGAALRRPRRVQARQRPFRPRGRRRGARRPRRPAPLLRAHLGDPRRPARWSPASSCR